MMKKIEEKQYKYIEDLIIRYPQLEHCKKDIVKAYCLLRDTYEANGKLLIAGNGGSAADAEHIVGELMKSFKKNRPLSCDLKKRLMAENFSMGAYLANILEQPLTAIALVGHEALSTAFFNDKDGKAVFAQQLLGFGKTNDVFLGISTSGNSENILHAAVVANAMDLHVIALTGATGGKLTELAECAICVPETETFKIQELHLPVYHCLCLMLENYFWN